MRTTTGVPNAGTRSFAASSSGSSIADSGLIACLATVLYDTSLGIQSLAEASVDT